MVNNNAINQFEAAYSNVEEAFNQYQAALQNNVDVYLHLKGMLRDRNISADAEFQRSFSRFYGLNRYLNTAQKQVFFTRMEALKYTESPINVRELTVALRPALGKNHFSFCSKMANMIDDTQYPIYDSHIRNVFHRRGLGYGLDYKENLYQDVTDTYRELKGHPIITAFQNRFNAQGMGYMKILDALFWALGR